MKTETMKLSIIVKKIGVLIALVFVMGALAQSVLAQPSAIQGVVKDAKGQAIKGADVRIESKDGKQQFNTVKTDGNGRYISEGLPLGVYRVTLVVNGAAKASITNTKTKANQTTQLNF